MLLRATCNLESASDSPKAINVPVARECCRWPHSDSPIPSCRRIAWGLSCLRGGIALGMQGVVDSELREQVPVVAILPA